MVYCLKYLIFQRVTFMKKTILMGTLALSIIQGVLPGPTHEKYVDKKEIS